MLSVLIQGTYLYVVIVLKNSKNLTAYGEGVTFCSELQEFYFNFFTPPINFKYFFSKYEHCSCG